MAAAAAPAAGRRDMLAYFPHAAPILSVCALDPEPLPEVAEPLRAIVCASLNPLPPTRGRVSTALPPPHTQLAVMRHVIRGLLQGHNPRSRPRHVLARGYRMSPSGVEMRHVNAQVELLSAPAWQWLLDKVGHVRMIALLSCPHTVLLRRLKNDNYHQVSGIAFDEFLRPATAPLPSAGPESSQAAASTAAYMGRAASGVSVSEDRSLSLPRRNPSAQSLTSPLAESSGGVLTCEHRSMSASSVGGSAAMPASPVPLSVPPPRQPAFYRASWELPRADLKPRAQLVRSTLGPQITQAPADGYRPTMLVCRRLYHGATSFSAVAGLDQDHILNTVLHVQPNAGTRARSRRGGLRASRSSQAALKLLYEEASAEAAPASIRQRSDDRLQATAWYNATTVPAAVKATGAATGNAARTLMNHVFIQMPHLQDVCCLNEGATSAQAWRSSHAGSPAQPGTRIPASLSTAVPVFRELLTRHQACPYASLLERFCPQPANECRESSMPVPRSAATVAELATDSIRLPEIKPLEVTVTHNAVMDFVRACLLHLVPPPLWGSQRMKRQVLTIVARWIRAGATDKIYLGDVTHELHTGDFTVFGSGRHPDTGIDTRTRHAVVWIIWLLLCLVTPLLRAHFYVTTSEVHHHVTLYYRKSVWARLTRAATASLMEQLSLRRVLAPELLTTLKAPTRREVGVARVKLVPKRATMRPIMNLAAATQLTMEQVLSMDAHDERPVRAGTKRGREHVLPSQPRLSTPAIQSLLGSQGRLELKPINRALQPLLEVLRRQRRAFPAAAGSATFGLDGAHTALRAFRALPVGGEARPLHMVTCDIRAAYDTIDQQLALECLKELLPADDTVFILRSFVVARVERGPPPRVRLRYLRVASVPSESASFADFSERVAGMFKGSVLVDVTEYQRVDRNDLMLLLAHHVCAHIVQLARHRFYLQQHGIPQGSSLSSLLCNVYLGSMEREHVVPALKAQCKQDSALLMRLTDDFICVSSSRVAAERFAQSMHAGNPKYGMMVSAAKTSASFPVSIERVENVPKVAGSTAVEPATSALRVVPPVLADARTAGVCVRWCGLQLHSFDGTVDSDYSRYFGRGSVRESVSMNIGTSVVRALSRMLVAFMRPKCHPIFFDANLHSPFAAAWNLYELCGLAAIKSVSVLNHALALKRPHCPRALEALLGHVSCALQRAEQTLWDMVQHRAEVASASAHPFAPAVQVGFAGVGQTDAAEPDAAPGAVVVGPACVAKSALPPCTVPLSRSELSWVFRKAFADVFRRAGEHFAPLLHILHSKLRRNIVVHDIGQACAARSRTPPRIRAMIIVAARSAHPQIEAMTWR